MQAHKRGSVFYSAGAWMPPPPACKNRCTGRPMRGSRRQSAARPSGWGARAVALQVVAGVAYVTLGGVGKKCTVRHPLSLQGASGTRKQSDGRCWTSSSATAGTVQYACMKVRCNFSSWTQTNTLLLSCAVAVHAPSPGSAAGPVCESKGCRPAGSLRSWCARCCTARSWARRWIWRS